MQVLSSAILHIWLLKKVCLYRITRPPTHHTQSPVSKRVAKGCTYVPNLQGVRKLFMWKNVDSLSYNHDKSKIQLIAFLYRYSLQVMFLCYYGIQIKWVEFRTICFQEYQINVSEFLVEFATAKKNGLPQKYEKFDDLLPALFKWTCDNNVVYIPLQLKHFVWKHSSYCCVLANEKQRSPKLARAPTITARY